MSVFTGPVQRFPAFLLQKIGKTPYNHLKKGNICLLREYYDIFCRTKYRDHRAISTFFFDKVRYVLFIKKWKKVVITIKVR